MKSYKIMFLRNIRFIGQLIKTVVLCEKWLNDWAK